MKPCSTHEKGSVCKRLTIVGLGRSYVTKAAGKLNERNGSTVEKKLAWLVN
jgi:hypothetical protein